MDIADTYRAMDDDELVRLHQKPEDLTDEARAALASELSRRGTGNSQIKEKQAQWQGDAEEERRRVAASRKAYVRSRFESLTQFGVILAVGIAYGLAVSSAFHLSDEAGEVVGGLVVTVAVVVWRLVRAFAPRRRLYWVATVALGGYILVTVALRLTLLRK